MRRGKIFSLTLVIVMMVSMIVGCQPEKTPIPDPTPTPTGFKDGDYREEGEVDERGWKPFIEIKVAGGKITEVKYDEMDEENQLKSENEDYNKAWKGAAGVNALEAYPKLENSLVESQDVDKVDTISGATQATNSFKELAKKALGKE